MIDTFRFAESQIVRPVIVAEHLGLIIDDGGRAAAGFKGKAGDCVTRAIAIASGIPYIEVYNALDVLAEQERPRGARRRSSARTGVTRPTSAKYLRGLGATWTPTMGIGTGCTVHLRRDELPEEGRLVLSLSKHFAAYVDGVLHDTYDCSRRGTRCVYGYWTMPT